MEISEIKERYNARIRSFSRKSKKPFFIRVEGDHLRFIDDDGLVHILRISESELEKFRQENPNLLRGKIKYLIRDGDPLECNYKIEINSWDYDDKEIIE